LLGKESSKAPNKTFHKTQNTRQKLFTKQITKYSKGPANKQNGDPRGGWVGGSDAEKGQGSDFFWDIFLSCF
jgi:hypothetical protein